jgi:hypothetical protein
MPCPLDAGKCCDDPRADHSSDLSEAQQATWYRAQRIVNDDRLIVIPMRGAASSFNIIDVDTRAEWVKAATRTSSI